MSPLDDLCFCIAVIISSIVIEFKLMSRSTFTSVMLTRSGGTGRLSICSKCCFHLSNFAFSSDIDVPSVALTGNSWLIFLPLCE